MRDVIVIGAGPAGLTTARVLAERGHDVLVLEEHPVVGHPVHCTGVLGLAAFDELDLPRQSILGIVRSACFSAGGGHPVLVESDRIRAAVVDRALFDAVLAERAVAAGATLETGVRIERFDVTRRRVSVRAVGGGAAIEGRALVLACGANYRFNRQIGLGVPRAFVQSAQVQMPFPALDHVDVRFGRDVAPGGFAWVVPFLRDGVSHARVGLFGETRARQRFQRFTATLAGQMGLAETAFPPPRLKMLPLGPVRRTFAARVLAVGDAAGLVKPTTGGGIYYGVLSGQFAADTLHPALARDALDERDLRGYQARWTERLGPEIRVGLAFRAIAGRLGDRSLQALVELARVDGLVPLLMETADFNWHRQAALALMRNPSFRRVVVRSIWG